jgi:hypothetical protein
LLRHAFHGIFKTHQPSDGTKLFQLLPRVGFIVTNLTLPSRAVVRFYNKRGTAE